jgi:hypothetical protein
MRPPACRQANAQLIIDNFVTLPQRLNERLSIKAFDFLRVRKRVQAQDWRWLRAEWIGLKIAPFQKGEPMLDERQDGGYGQVLVRAGVSAQIRGGQFEQGGGRTKPALLQVNERARQLDQPLVKSAVSPLPVLEPKLFQNIVRLVKFPAIEAVKITLIKWIKPACGAVPDHARDSFSFVAHGLIVLARRIDAPS